MAQKEIAAILCASAAPSCGCHLCDCRAAAFAAAVLRGFSDCGSVTAHALQSLGNALFQCQAHSGAQGNRWKCEHVLALACLAAWLRWLGRHADKTCTHCDPMHISSNLDFWSFPRKKVGGGFLRGLRFSHEKTKRNSELQGDHPAIRRFFEIFPRKHF